ncbi:MAG: single-stranded-DNA-specific exonuclease RecJ [Methylothermaceae bacteria B42]|nr:MAG: single-stranded-DNA-specific exonuclease RecJ [Methylothermaceae bacteria B42]
MVPRPVPDGDHQLPSELHPVLKRVYLARGIRGHEDLDLSLKRLPSPWLLQGMEVMVDRLLAAIRQQKSILVVADYDADGATACAVAMLGLRALGARRVDFIVPDRFRDGYGLTPSLVRAAMAKNPQLLLTVDNGIASIAGVVEAKAEGLEVLITDHHLPGEQLPGADAIVNPNVSGDGFPGKALSGVGVMFYVLTALRSKMREQGEFERLGLPEPNLAELLDLVALGTVADVVPLDSVNRILVHQGLQRMRAGRARPGIRALIEVAGRQSGHLSAADLGFAVGPRLNAAGRLEDMSLGIRCLLADDSAQAMQLAVRLDTLNRERREIEARMKDDALLLLAAEDWRTDQSNGVCLFDESWHEGVIGILASRIRERLSRPVIAFAPGEDGLLKGSARSIPGLHIRDLLSEVDAYFPGLILRYGGHAMAAGLTLERTHFDRFVQAFDEHASRHLAQLVMEDQIHTDGALEAGDFSLELARSLRLGGPWGQGFPEPLFHGDFQVASARIVGEKHLKLQVKGAGIDKPLDAIAFFPDNPAEWLSCSQIRLAYQLEINEFRGLRQLQLNVDYMEPLS